MKREEAEEERDNGIPEREREREKETMRYDV